jgi:TRAP-type C4-dicarboxylate transport system permease small subunit
VLLFFYAVSLLASYKYVSFMKVEHSAYLHVPINWMYSVYLIFAVACLCRYAWLVRRAIGGATSPATDPAKVGD